jgi:hypothetical protein
MASRADRLPGRCAVDSGSMSRPIAWLAAAAALVAACSSSSSSSTSSDAGSNDASVSVDGGTLPDSSVLDAAVDASQTSDATIDGDAAAGCGEFTGDTNFTCSDDGNSRGECVNGVLDQESCDRGCLGPAGSNVFSCTGSYGTTPSTDGDYYLTEFGCWVDPQGTTETDPDDNCVPSCFSQAKAAGLCMPGDTGPACEERINWFTADGARFGCLARLRVTNPANGKSVIAVALDYGPGCSGEQNVDMEVLDASGRVDLELFGGPEGSSDHALVHVVQVDDSTPLGPTP